MQWPGLAVDTKTVHAINTGLKSEKFLNHRMKKGGETDYDSDGSFLSLQDFKGRTKTNRAFKNVVFLVQKTMI